MDRITKISTVVALSAAVMAAPEAHAAKRSTEPVKLERPNVVWYLIEDTSPQYLALYNKGKGAKQPNLEKLSKECIIYDNAFSSAPVSSAARTSLITSCYAPRFGGSLHRRLEELPMPEGLNMFPSYLRNAGYYTCNAAKTDYNVILDKTAWDKINGKLGDWRGRKDPSQPFFYMRTNAVTHESKLLFTKETYETVKTKTNPEDVFIHPSLPSTDLMKYTYATFYDRIGDADVEFGKMLDMLKEDGLMDNTFIFFFGDNGGCVPESKGYTNDVGFRVPLLIYVPEVWREAVGIPVGEHTDGMVSFIDFGATVLNLAGIDTPAQSNGVPFLGEGADVSGEESVVCYGDRFDDLYAFNRVLYRGKYRYARNYTPYHARGLHSYYRYKSLALQEAREMYNNGELNELQAKFFEPLGAEELYDLASDPNETRNLASDPEYKSVLNQMRIELASKVDNYCDLGFLPETILNEETMKNPASWGDAHQLDLIKYRRLADLQLEPMSAANATKISTALDSDDTVEAWWGLTSGAYFSDEMGKCDCYKSKVAELTQPYQRSFVRARAFVAEARMGGKVTEADVKSMLDKSRTLGETLLVLNDMAYLHDMKLLPIINLTDADTHFSDYSVKERVAYLSNTTPETAKKH